MAQRTHTARFMPGAWVFPGGVVDDEDWSPAAEAALDGLRDPDDLGWVAAAVRETVEETGVWLADEPFTVPESGRVKGASIFEQATGERRFAVGGMAYFANWITPADLPVRFDARFYVKDLKDDVAGEPDRTEMDAVAWVAVAEAVAKGRNATMSIAFPTLKTLELFASFDDAAALHAWAQDLDHVPVTEPRIRMDDDVVQIVLPWDPGYNELPAFNDDVDVLRRIASARGVDGTPAVEFQPPKAQSGS